MIASVTVPNSSRPSFAIYMPFMVQIMGLSPARRQPIIWTIDGLLSISLQATYFQEWVIILCKLESMPAKFCPLSKFGQENVVYTVDFIIIHNANLTLMPRQYGRHFPDDIFKCIFLNENVKISIKISLKFAFKGSIDYIPALVQIKAWRRPGDKPLPEPMIVSLPTHTCVFRPQ